MKNYSIWQDIKKISFPKLNENISCDVLIIGGGITGASAYYHLKDTNLNVVLVEQGKIGMSTTSRSTGKLTFLQNDLLDKIRNNFSNKTLSLYLNSQIEGIKLIKEIIKKEKINCDLESVASILYTNRDMEVKKLIKLRKFLENNNIKTNEIKNNLVESKYMFEVSDTYMFHPLKFVYGLLKNKKNIYEETSIKKIIKKDNMYYCYTDNLFIKTKWVILASHYPYFNIPYIFPLKACLEKSYLSASKSSNDKMSLISYSNPFISIRTYKDYLIYLSNSHEINKDICDKNHFNELLKKVNDLNLSPEYLWSNIDIMTSDGLPYIGKIKDNMLIVTGYNTWGLINGVLSGKILKSIILNEENKYINLFNPKRKNINKLEGLFTNSYKSIEGYFNGFINGTDYKCPHMKCFLIYNEIENTYDCPCHGSRFNSNGNIISSPSNKDFK